MVARLETISLPAHVCKIQHVLADLLRKPLQVDCCRLIKCEQSSPRGQCP